MVVIYTFRIETENLSASDVRRVEQRGDPNELMWETTTLNDGRDSMRDVSHSERQ